MRPSVWVATIVLAMCVAASDPNPLTKFAINLHGICKKLIGPFQSPSNTYTTHYTLTTLSLPMAAVATTVVAPVVAVKKPLNAYQLFINEKVAELKPLEEYEGKKYMELRALANAEWRKIHPVDESKAARAPRKPKAEKEPVGISEADSDSADEAQQPAAAKKRKSKKEPKLNADGTPKAKRAPTPYNLFISAALLELKAEYADKPADQKPAQKELMKLAAAKWREFKAAAEAPQSESEAEQEPESEEPEAEQESTPVPPVPEVKPKKNKSKKNAAK